jgi:hypothetical protein
MDFVRDLRVDRRGRLARLFPDAALNPPMRPRIGRFIQKEKSMDAFESRDLETVLDDPAGFIETFIQERPLAAVAMAVITGALLARRLFHSPRPNKDAA